MRDTIRQLKGMSLYDLGEGLVRMLDRGTEKIWAALVLESVDKQPGMCSPTTGRAIMRTHWQ